MLGTIAYMSPEQVCAKELDARTDLFSFGAVLYEMATGKMPFSGSSSGQICGAILHQEPVPPSQLNPHVGSGIEAVIRKALEKDRELRYQSAADIRADLQQLRRETESGRTAATTSSSAAAAPVVPAIPKKKRWRIIAPATVLAMAAVAAGLYYGTHRSTPLTDKDTVVIADFANSTGDPVFDDTLRTAVTVALNQSPFLDVLAESRVAASLKLMTRPAGTRLTSDVAREVCQRTGCKAYIAGSIAGMGSEYVLGLNAVNCQTGDTLAQEQVTAAAKEKVLNALGEAASKLRRHLGESLATVQKFDVPLREATTSSLEALKAYSLASKVRNEQGNEGALPYGQRVIQLDPNFAMAYLTTGQDYNSLGQIGRAAQYATKAFELRDHASEREKLIISAYYFRTVTGELEKAASTYEELSSSYPRSAAATSLGLTYGALGEYAKARDAAGGGPHPPPHK
jgi:hypothetical protein